MNIHIIIYVHQKPSFVTFSFPFPLHKTLTLATLTLRGGCHLVVCICIGDSPCVCVAIFWNFSLISLVPGKLRVLADNQTVVLRFTRFTV